MAFPFAELNGSDPAHVDWVKSQREPGLWHAFTTALVTAGDPGGFLPWVFDQPEVDRATAGYVFLGVQGREYLGGQTLFEGEGLSTAEWLSAMEAVCRRGASDFAHDVLGLAPGFEAERLACLDLVLNSATAPDAIVPLKILSAPFPVETPLAYFVEDGVVLSYDPMAF